MDTMDSIVESVVTSSPCDDIWKKFDDFLLTPPQSPPIKFPDFCNGETLISDDFSNALDSFLETSLTESALTEVLNSCGLPDIDVLHDCMWSGQGIEEQLCSSGNLSVTGRNNNSFGGRSETPLLGSSPLGISGFGDMLATCPDMDVSEAMDTATHSMDDDSSSSHSHASSHGSATSGFVSSNESLINDHSYGSPKNSPRPAVHKQAQSE